MSAERRVVELGLELPVGTAPAANYANAVRSGNLMFLSGKAPLAVDGAQPKGRLGREFDAARGYAFARSACLDLLAVLRHELGSLDRVARFVELQGFLNATEDFEDHAKVLNGASDLLVDVLGARRACPLGARRGVAARGPARHAARRDRGRRLTQACHTPKPRSRKPIASSTSISHAA